MYLSIYTHTLTKKETQETCMGSGKSGIINVKSTMCSLKGVSPPALLRARCSAAIDLAEGVGRRRAAAAAGRVEDDALPVPGAVSRRREWWTEVSKSSE